VLLDVFSRHGKDWSNKVPGIVEAMLALPAPAMLDGEGVIVDDRGVTDFEGLRSAVAGRGGSRSVFLFAFDVLELDGENMRREPWEIRRATLVRLLCKAGPGIRSEHLNGEALLAGKLDVRGKVVAVVLSGGNVDPELFHRLVA
jgi:bifunctional non-homologous end joining protein LigD